MTKLVSSITGIGPSLNEIEIHSLYVVSLNTRPNLRDAGTFSMFGVYVLSSIIGLSQRITDNLSIICTSFTSSISGPSRRMAGNISLFCIICS